MRETSMLLLAWDKFLLDFNERIHVDMAYKATLVLTRQKNATFPEQREQHSRKMAKEKRAGTL
jgi:hypothetical protein